MTPLILSAAITGGGAPKARSPHHPITPQQIVAEALACARAGAAVIHLHARCADGTSTSDAAAFRSMVAQIRAAGCDAILNLSAGDDGGRATHAQRLAVIEAGGEIVSFAPSSYNSGGRLYDNAPAFLADMVTRMRAAAVRPEIEILDLGFLDRLQGFIASGGLKPPYQVIFGFGLSGAMPPDPRLLPLLIERLPTDAVWSVACPTDDHAVFLRIAMAAFVNGGHLRTGMEDLVLLRPGELAQSNAQMVAQWVDTARMWGRPIATPAEARRMLGLAPTPAAGA